MIGAILAKKAAAGALVAINGKDLDKFMSAWADDGVFIYPGDIPQSGTYKGIDNVRAWFSAFLEQFPGLTFDIKDVCVRDSLAMTGNNVVAVHWDLKLHNREGRDGVNTGVTVITIKGGKVVEVKDCLFDTGEEFKKNWSAI